MKERKNIITEEWKDIPYCNGHYEASNLGNFRSKDRITVCKNGRSIFFSGAPLATRIDKQTRYPVVSLGRYGMNTIHRVLALTFIPKPKNAEQVNHKDYNRGNYALSNLEWVTRHENLAHQYKDGRMNAANRAKNKDAYNSQPIPIKKKPKKYSLYVYKDVLPNEGNERWADIKGCPGYQISTLGNARSLRRTVTYSCGKTVSYGSKLLLPYNNGNGYYYFHFSGKKYVKISVHRVVAMAFLPNPKRLKEVHHKDFDRKNNRVDNLEWVSRAENSSYTKKAGRHNPPDVSGEKNPRARLSVHDILLIRKEGRDITKTNALVKRYGVTYSHIRNIVYKRIWRHL